MQRKEKHNRPLYYTGYIRSSEVSRIQVDPGPVLSIMPRRVMHHLEISAHRLSVTQTTIYGFNANGTRPMGKIKLKCQIRDLKSEVMCYVIDANTSYNLLQGRSWIHRKFIVPSTIYQVMKYVNEERGIRTLIAEKHPFKRVENYFTDSFLYQDSPKTAKNSSPENPDSGNEVEMLSQKQKKSVSQSWTPL